MVQQNSSEHLSLFCWWRWYDERSGRACLSLSHWRHFQLPYSDLFWRGHRTVWFWRFER